VQLMIGSQTVSAKLYNNTVYCSWFLYDDSNKNCSNKDDNFLE